MLFLDEKNCSNGLSENKLKLSRSLSVMWMRVVWGKVIQERMAQMNFSLRDVMLRARRKGN